jgi:hypothetical protein
VFGDGGIYMGDIIWIYWTGNSVDLVSL